MLKKSLLRSTSKSLSRLEIQLFPKLYATVNRRIGVSEFVDKVLAGHEFGEQALQAIPDANVQLFLEQCDKSQKAKMESPELWLGKEAFVSY